MSDKHTEIIRIWGVVQGVGFRPFAAKLARKMCVRGCVRNVGSLAEITITGSDHEIESYLTRLATDLPPPGEVVHYTREAQEKVADFAAFTISESLKGNAEAGILPADLAICDECSSEMMNPADRRWMHPFISCMSCGPRFTIMKHTPYDRDNTSMEDFFLCGDCAKEYEDIECRRHHAQTVSCHNCGPVLLWRGRNGPATSEDSGGKNTCNDTIAIPDESSVSVETREDVIKGEIVSTSEDRARDNTVNVINTTASVIRGGGVIALKAPGGYCLACSPFAEDAVKKLRAIKNRDEKPFAVMFMHLSEIRQFCKVSEPEEELLLSRARPILLLERYELSQAGKNICRSVYRNSRFLGAFLPSMGVQHMLLDKTGPLIMTSANLSGMPIIKDDEEALKLLMTQPLLDGVLYNERRIITRADDSVICATDGNPQIIRRSKGYVPMLLNVPGRGIVLAVGGQLKSTFTLTSNGHACMSQCFGDLDTVENENVYLEELDHMKSLLRIDPERFICDLHPNYTTTRIAENLSEASGAPLLRVQHHHAHIASVIAEHNLNGTVIGVAFDGTGYGDDGNIWGGEFLLCEGSGFSRLAHLAYVPMIGGDASINESWKTALCYKYAYDKYAYESKQGMNGGCAAQRRGESGVIPRQLVIDLSEIIEYNERTRGDVLFGRQNQPYEEIAMTAGSNEEAAIRTAVKAGANEEAAIRTAMKAGANEEAAIRAAMTAGANEEKAIRAALKAGTNVIKSSSAGRLFDAVASLLGIHHINRYEGECAIMLENAAVCGQKSPGENEVWDLALRFHMNLAKLVLESCTEISSETGVVQVALSGGVFQNRLLLKECLNLLGNVGFVVYTNSAVPVNDGGISLGQAYLGSAV